MTKKAEMEFRRRMKGFDSIDVEILKEIFPLAKETKEKFSQGLQLILGKNMDPKEAMKVSGFEAAYRKELQALKATA